MGILGDVLFRGASVWQTLIGNTTATKKFFTQLGTGTLSAAPVWSTILNADLPNSGVSASTYGSSTAIPIITVNVKGIITAASTTSFSTGGGTVTTTGTTSTGSLMKFSSPSSITNTDLTGDITTSGFSTTTLSTTGVTATTVGSSTSIPIVTVDAKGRLTALTSTTAASTTSGITQLTSDVTAGPGSGSQVATLSTTGVTAASYGSSSAIPVITVDAKGRITAASTTTISTTSGAVVSLASTTLVSSTTSVTFSSISGSYTHLFVIAKGRLTSAVTDDYLKMQFNGDTGANYDHQQSFGTGATASNAAVYGTTNGGRIADWTGASASTTIQAAMVRIDIPFYTNTSFGKDAQSVTGAVFGTSGSTILSGTFHMYWRNTSAVTSITFVGASGSLAANSMFSLYGVS